MTEGNVDPETIRKTQESLGKFVKKPPLTEKLLKKPPFKFIHDVIKVVRTTKLDAKRLDRTSSMLYRSNLLFSFSRSKNRFAFGKVLDDVCLPFP